MVVLIASLASPILSSAFAGTKTASSSVTDSGILPCPGLTAQMPADCLLKHSIDCALSELGLKADPCNQT